MLTPNQFEAQLLSGVTIRSPEDAARACDVLHARGPRLVLLTSCSFEGEAETGTLRLIVSSVVPPSEGAVVNGAESGTAPVAQRFQIEVPKLAHSFTGTGAPGA